MIGRDHVLYSVSDVFNGVMVKGNMVGTTMFYGSGAGKLPTASAVVADIIAAVRHKNMNIAIGWSEERQTIAPMDTSSYRYFVRVDGNCEENRSRVEAVFGKAELTVLDGLDEFAFVTEKMTEAAFKEKAVEFDSACQAFGKKGILQMIRAEL